MNVQETMRRRCMISLGLLPYEPFKIVEYQDTLRCSSSTEEYESPDDEPYILTSADEFIVENERHCDGGVLTAYRLPCHSGEKIHHTLLSSVQTIPPRFMFGVKLSTREVATISFEDMTPDEQLEYVMKLSLEEEKGTRGEIHFTPHFDRWTMFDLRGLRMYFSKKRIPFRIEGVDFWMPESAWKEAERRWLLVSPDNTNLIQQQNADFGECEFTSLYGN